MTSTEDIYMTDDIDKTVYYKTIQSELTDYKHNNTCMYVILFTASTFMILLNFLLLLKKVKNKKKLRVVIGTISLSILFYILAVLFLYMTKIDRKFMYACYSFFYIGIAINIVNIIIIY